LFSLRPCKSASRDLCLSVSCVGRRLVPGEQTEEELEAVGPLLPEGGGHVVFCS